jgi:hypothetical protein
LFAFIGDGDAGDDDIAIAGIQRGEDPFPRRIDQFDLEAFGLGHRLDDVDVEAFQLLLAVFKLERPIGAAGADDVVGSAASAAVEKVAARQAPIRTKRFNIAIPDNEWLYIGIIYAL